MVVTNEEKQIVRDAESSLQKSIAQLRFIKNILEQIPYLVDAKGKSKWLGDLLNERSNIENLGIALQTSQDKIVKNIGGSLKKFGLDGNLIQTTPKEFLKHLDDFEMAKGEVLGDIDECIFLFEILLTQIGREKTLK